MYIGRSHHAEHEYDIRFALGQTVWPLEVIKLSENGVPHSSFIYRPNRLKMHQTTCRGPSYGNTQQELDRRILRSKVKVKYAKNPIFKHGVPHSSFIYQPNRLKMQQTTFRGPSYGNTQQEPDWRILRSIRSRLVIDSGQPESIPTPPQPNSSWFRLRFRTVKCQAESNPTPIPVRLQKSDSESGVDSRPFHWLRFRSRFSCYL